MGQSFQNEDFKFLNETKQLQALIEAENSLRFTVGRYIHDTIQQRLQMAISLLQAEAADSSTELNQNLLDLLNQADVELALIRREVLPTDPQAAWFRLALETYIEDDFLQLHPDTPFEIFYALAALDEVYAEWRPTAVAEKMLISLFIREGLRNAYKHAQATQVKVESRVFTSNHLPQLPKKFVRVLVRDNGQGFDLPQLNLASTHQSSFADFEVRARLLGGCTKLKSRLGAGTAWRLYLPLLDNN